jgi:versiconal hemiacetal acetate esterase
VFVASASCGGALALGITLRLIEAGKRDRIKGIVALVPWALHWDAVLEDMRDRYQS